MERLNALSDMPVREQAQQCMKSQLEIKKLEGRKKVMSETRKRCKQFQQNIQQYMEENHLEAIELPTDDGKSIYVRRETDRTSADPIHPDPFARTLEAWLKTTPITKLNADARVFDKKIQNRIKRKKKEARKAAASGSTPQTLKPQARKRAVVRKRPAPKYDMETKVNATITTTPREAAEERDDSLERRSRGRHEHKRPQNNNERGYHRKPPTHRSRSREDAKRQRRHRHHHAKGGEI